LSPSSKKWKGGAGNSLTHRREKKKKEKKGRGSRGRERKKGIINKKHVPSLTGFAVRKRGAAKTSPKKRDTDSLEWGCGTPQEKTQRGREHQGKSVSQGKVQADRIFFPRDRSKSFPRRQSPVGTSGKKTGGDCAGERPKFETEDWVPSKHCTYKVSHGT